MPSWINMDLFQESVKILKEHDIQYADKVSYHQMCRWNSGLFYKHPALANTQFYWRVEPKVHFFCDIDYDVFRYMQDHNKTYGFTINLYDAPESIPTLWPETQKFLAHHPEYLHENNAANWVVDKSRRPDHWDKANGYSTCHFWSNFEIGDMNFWRSQAYEDYFNHLDRAGGFFYERWGDAPVHSIALGLFEDRNRIHWYAVDTRPIIFKTPISLTVTFQVPRHRVSAHSFLQLPQLAQMQGLRNRPLHGRRGMVAQGRLPTQLVQVRTYELSKQWFPSAATTQTLFVCWGRLLGTKRTAYAFLVVTAHIYILSRIGHFAESRETGLHFGDRMEHGVWCWAGIWHFIACRILGQADLAVRSGSRSSNYSFLLGMASNSFPAPRLFPFPSHSQLMPLVR